MAGAKKPDAEKRNLEDLQRAEDGALLGGGYSWGRGKFETSARGAGEEMLRGRHERGERDGD